MCNSVLTLKRYGGNKLTQHPCARDHQAGDCASAEGYTWRTVREWLRRAPAVAR